MTDQKMLDLLARYTAAVRYMATRGSPMAAEVAQRLEGQLLPLLPASRTLSRYAELLAQHAAIPERLFYEWLEHAASELLVALLGRAPTDREIENLLTNE